MSGSFPGARVHKYGAVKSRIVRRFLNEFFPPCFFDVIFEFYAQRTEVPGVRKSAVYFASGENVSSVFAECHKLLHGYASLFSHNYNSFTPYSVRAYKIIL